MDVDNMAKKAIQALKTDYHKYLSLQNSPKTLSFIEKHRSWKKVALAELKNLEPYLLNCDGT